MKNMSYEYSVTISDDKEFLVILDQTLLPDEEKYLYLNRKEEILEAIKSLRVRGAPAIGIAAAFGIYVLTKHIDDDFVSEFENIKNYLITARPTAVNLSWALLKMHDKLKEYIKSPLDVIKDKLLKQAILIQKEDEEVCAAIGRNGLMLLDKGMGIMTHCNAGSLATAKYGTALAPVYAGNEAGYGFKVYANETRPLLQGSRLTVWELQKHQVDVTLLCDNAASEAMRRGYINAVITGCDRVSGNGDTANKIGTSAVAILAKEYGIPFYICSPTSTIDLLCKTGKDIVIEERDGEEIYIKWFIKPMAPLGTKTFNPAFDITDHKYITAIITEYGVIYPPFEEGLKAHKEKSER